MDSPEVKALKERIGVLESGDYNGDGVVNIGDVTALARKILEMQ